MSDQFKTVTVEITGTNPLLMHAFKEENLLESTRKMDKNLTKEQLAEKFTYRDEQGYLYIPKQAIWGCLTEAGRYVTFHGKKRVATKKDSLLALGLAIIEEKISLGVKDYIIDAQAVINPSTGGHSMCYRPRLNEWKVTFNLRINTKEFILSLVRELLDKAGTVAGLLDYRPSRKGWFGTFKVTRFDFE